MQTQIKAMALNGFSIRRIAMALGISRQSVRKFKEETQGVETEKPTKTRWDGALNWTAIAETKKRGVTAKQLHKEFAPEVKYGRFWRRLRSALKLTVDVTIRRVDVIGERVEVDYTDGIDIVNAQTGVVTKTHLFCGVLPFSSYVFGEFVFTQKLHSFISSHIKMFAAFGGVTPYLVADNLKSGVTRAHRYDPDVNNTYCDFGNHMGFVVMPARPYTPKDKPCVENGIGVIQDNFFQEVRGKIFYSIGELNEWFHEYLKRLNASEMKDYGTSRDARFLEEKKHLKPLPISEFQMMEWKQAKVHPDCHIQVERNFYSVPFQFVSQAVRVRLTSRLVEVFPSDGTVAMAVHARAAGIGKISTNEAHYPEMKLAIKRFDVEAAKRQAAAIGPKTLGLVEGLISGDYPLKHLRRIQGIVRLHSSGAATKAALEYACTMAQQFARPRFQYVKSCALHFDKNGAKPKLVTPHRDADASYLHEKKAGAL